MTPEQIEDAILTYFQKADKEIRKPSEPPSRWQPKIVRHQSREQTIVSGQSKNPIKAIYTPESEWSQTPLLREDAVTTREVGPGDRYNSETNYRSGKATTEPTESN